MSTKNKIKWYALKGRNQCQKKLARIEKVRNLFLRIYHQSTLLNSANIYSNLVSWTIQKIRTEKFRKINFLECFGLKIT